MYKQIRLYLIPLVFLWTLPTSAALADASDSSHDTFKIDSDTFSHGKEEGNVRTGDNIIEIYGKVMISFTENRPGNVSLQSSGSRLGIRGNKTLETNLLSFWQIESSVDLDNLGSDEHEGNTSEFAGRDSFVGISWDWGTLVFGKHNTPYKMAVHSWDPFNHVAGDFRAILGRIPGYAVKFDHHGSMFHIRSPNSIIYYPDLDNGLSASFAVAAIDESVNNNSNYPILSARVTYQVNNFELVYAHETHSSLDVIKAGEHVDDHVVDTTPETYIDNSHANLFGIMYHIPNTMFSAIVEHIDIKDQDTENASRLAVLASVVHNIKRNSLRFTLGRAGEFHHEDGAIFSSIGLFKMLSKETNAYINFANIQNDKEGQYPTFYLENAQSNVSSFSIGLTHSF